jgi:allantoinase
MRASPRDFYDAHRGAFDYLVENEPMGLLALVVHCQFGGRPLITSALEETLKYLARSQAVWFARHEQLANWALTAETNELMYRRRFFERPVQVTP